jgi:hypothetical protein
MGRMIEPATLLGDRLVTIVRPIVLRCCPNFTNTLLAEVYCSFSFARYKLANRMLSNDAPAVIVLVPVPI